MPDDLVPHTHRGFAPRRSAPYGRTADFVRRVGETHGEPFVKSWLNEQNCDFTSDTIFTTGIGCDRLNSRCGEIAESFMVRIVSCPFVRKRFASSRPQEAGKRHGSIAVRVSRWPHLTFDESRLVKTLAERLPEDRRAAFKSSIEFADGKIKSTAPEFSEWLTEQADLQGA